jgi:hypothetical protein
MFWDAGLLEESFPKHNVPAFKHPCHFAPTKRGVLTPCIVYSVELSKISFFFAKTSLKVENSLRTKK